MRHKLTTFITKNPPPKKQKGAKGASKSAGQSVEEADGGDTAGGGNSDDELTQRINAEAADLPTMATKKTKDDDWSVDTSEEAVKARVKALEGGISSSLVLDGDDDDNDENSPYNQFGLWLMANRKGGEEDRECTAAEVFKKAQELGIEKKHKAVQVLVQGLFTEDVVNELKKYGPVVAKMTTSEKHQKSLLGGVERLAGVQYPALIPNGVPKVLMSLYQLDALDEEVVKTWASHVSKKYVDKDTSKKVRKAATPFVTWLDEADDDDSDSEEDDDGEERQRQEGRRGRGRRLGPRRSLSLPVVTCISLTPLFTDFASKFHRAYTSLTISIDCFLLYTLCSGGPLLQPRVFHFLALDDATHFNDILLARLCQEGDDLTQTSLVDDEHHPNTIVESPAHLPRVDVALLLEIREDLRPFPLPNIDMSTKAFGQDSRDIVGKTTACDV